MYVFHNLSDEQLRKLSSAVHQEQKQRFLRTVEKYPKLYDLPDSIVEGVKVYRARYNLSLSDALMLFNHYHR